MLVSFIVVALNAGDKLNSLIQDLRNQDYDHGKIEVILVDSNSNDITKQIMLEFRDNMHDFSRVIVLDNPKNTLPCGWNVALKEVKGDIVLRVDAHTAIPKEFVTNNVTCIKSGENICGGNVSSIIDSNNSWQKLLLLAENSAFGGGIASFRRNNEKRYVDTIAFAAYRSEVFEIVGHYDERLARTEDNEMHYRMKLFGYKFLMDPKICSSRYARSTLAKLIKQKYSNGYWIGLTMGVSPKCFSLYHFVPLMFILSIIITTILATNGLDLPSYLLWGTYFMGAVLMTVLSIVKNKFDLVFLLLPCLFFMIHFSYGVGTLVGIIRMPFWLTKN